MLPQTLLLALLPFAYAQNYGSGSSSSSTSSAASSSTSATASTQSGIHNIVVGAGGALVFQPNTVTAAVGDKLVFQFMPGGHSVANGPFDTPCQPSPNGIFSGYFTPSSGVDSQVFVVTVNNTDPIYVYCSQVGHCNAGMVMGVNTPSSGNTVAAYKSAAASAKLIAPSKVEGGVVEAQSAVGSGSSGSSTSASSTSAPATSTTAASTTAASTTAASKGAASRYAFDTSAAVIGAGLLAWALM